MWSETKLCKGSPITVCSVDGLRVQNTAGAPILNTSHPALTEYLLHARNWKHEDTFHIILALK